MTTPDQTSPPITGYRFELIFSILFTLYCWIYYGIPLSPVFGLPLGLLNLVFLFGLYSKEQPLIFLIVALVSGFVVGWVIRTLWQNGSIGKTGLIILLLANALSFYYLLNLPAA